MYPLLHPTCESFHWISICLVVYYICTLCCDLHTLGTFPFAAASWVTMVRTVVTPSVILSATAFRLTQNDNQDRITIRPDGM